MSNQVLIPIVLAFTFVVGLPQPDSRIFGGSEAEVGQFPHQASLQIHNRHYCGGAIISNLYVLTAGHCDIAGQTNLNDYSVVVGAHKNKANDGQAYGVKRFILHEYYQVHPLSNDIALVEVNAPIAFNERVQPILLGRTHVGGDVEAFASGWGKTNDLNTNLKFVTLKTLTNDECKRKTGNQGPINDVGTLCAYSGKLDHGACNGDSGGPLTANNTLIGLVSWGFPCARGLPDGFTRVSDYIDWIHKSTGLF